MNRLLPRLAPCFLIALVLALLAPASLRAGEIAFGVAVDSSALSGRPQSATTPVTVLRAAHSTEATTPVTPAPATHAAVAARPSAPRTFNTANIDGRFLRYRDLLAAIATSKDSVASAYDQRERTSLFASVSDLARLERELDDMERALDAQRGRLEWLQRDFASRQRTELDIVLTGAAREGRVDSVVVTLEDGTRSTAALNGTQRESLRHGSTLEVFRGLVEPHSQAIDVALFGDGWSAVGHGLITLEPARNQVTFLKLDLAQAQPARGVSSIMAGTWTLDPGLPAADADRERP